MALVRWRSQSRKCRLEFQDPYSTGKFKATLEARKKKHMVEFDGLLWHLTEEIVVAAILGGW